jgi:prepilin-type N-terminal cleavage/methylation domain-containing protein/prepilin-type processing-associated H-X9-DG protein
MNTTVENKGFNIIELLIVLVVIAVLAGVVIPVLYAAKHRAQQIVCVNNLRQIFLALEQYTNDNNGWLPRPNNSDTSKDGTKECSAEVWFKAIDRYLMALQPPSNRDTISLEERLLQVKQDPIFKTVPLSKQDTTRTIKMNQNILPASECQRSIETIGETTRTVLLFDGRINNTSVADNYEGSYGSVAQKHSKAANILFIDGHVERIQNGNSDGTTNEGWPDRQAGRGLIWDPDNPDLH